VQPFLHRQDPKLARPYLENRVYGRRLAVAILP